MNFLKFNFATFEDLVNWLQSDVPYYVISVFVINVILSILYDLFKFSRR